MHSAIKRNKIETSRMLFEDITTEKYISPKDAEMCVLGLYHGMESTILTVREKSILASCLYGTWVMKINP